MADRFEVNFPQLASFIPNADLLFQRLDYCYGQPFELTLNIMGSVLTLCSPLELPSLADPLHKIISKVFSKPVSLQLPPRCCPATLLKCILFAFPTYLLTDNL
ncbi:hypothetical protein GEMRC1_006582 [Eukaryota sp. GEM-RC1]